MSRQNKEKRHYSRLAGHILRRFLLSVVAYISALAGLCILAKSVCSRIVWQAGDPVYMFLRGIEAVLVYLIPLLIITGVILLTWRFFGKSFEYLDVVVEAAEKLSAPSTEPIRLLPGLGEAENALNLAREQALRNSAAVKEAEQRKNDLIVYLAHDLKTPLTSVIGYLSLLRDEPQISDELRAKYIGIAFDKAGRLEELINEFFEITRLNLSTLTLEKETISLSRMLEQITSEFNPVLAGRQLSWDLDIGQDVRISCDPDKLERVFDNLFRNAVSYSYPGTSISVSLHQTEDEVCIVVLNHGRTIPAAKLSRIFEQFFRLDSSRSSETGGSGLGLAIAKEIVELHGGSISAQSADETVSFTVVLPA